MLFFPPVQNYLPNIVIVMHLVWMQDLIFMPGVIYFSCFMVNLENYTVFLVQKILHISYNYYFVFIYYFSKL